MNFNAWLHDNNYIWSPTDINKPGTRWLINDLQSSKYPKMTFDQVMWIHFRKLFLEYYTLSSCPKMNINADVEAGLTPLMVAVMNGLVDMVKMLVQNPKIKLNKKSKDQYETTAAHLVFETDLEDNFEVLKVLVEVPGIDWNMTDGKQRSPFEYAIRYEKFKEIQLLLEKTNMNPNLRNSYGGNTTLLTIMCCDDGDDKVRQLKLFTKLPNIDWNIRNDAGLTVAISATDELQSEKVWEVLATVPTIDWNVELLGCSPLRIALQTENFPFLRFLFTLPSVKYVVEDLYPSIFSQMVDDTTLRKCLAICRQDHKRTGYNYSDVFDFLTDALCDLKRQSYLQILEMERSQYQHYH